MARTFAQVPVMLWGRDSFRNLSESAQRLYLVLATSPTLTLAAVTDWRPKRLVSFAADSTEEGLAASLAELQIASVATVDEETEEVWLNSLISDDRILRSPKTAAGMVASWAMVGSDHIRKAISDSVRAQVEHDDVSPTVQHILIPLLEYRSERTQAKVAVPPPRVRKPANRFGEFWDAYPKHEAKAGAQKIYDRLVAKGQSEQDLIDGAIRYAVQKYGQDPKYTKQPTTWLNQGCWADEYEEGKKGDLYNPASAWD